MDNGEGTGPRLVVGTGYALYRGPLADSHTHRHAAFQVAYATGTADPVPMVTVTDGNGVRHRGAALVVAPMVRHRMEPVRELVSYFIDPHCAFADRLRTPGGPGITAAPHWRGLREEQVRPAGALPSARVDPRLRAAMEAAERRRPPAGRSGGPGRALPATPAGAGTGAVGPAAGALADLAAAGPRGRRAARGQHPGRGRPPRRLRGPGALRPPDAGDDRADARRGAPGPAPDSAPDSAPGPAPDSAPGERSGPVNGRGGRQSRYAVRPGGPRTARASR